MANIITRETLHRINDQLYAACACNIWTFLENVKTQDEEMASMRPFPINFPHVQEIHRIAEENDRALFCKSRRMQVSMYFLARKLHKGFFAGTELPGTYDVYRGAYSATDEPLMKYQLARIQFMYDSLPPWMQARNPMVKNTESVKAFQKGGVIEGFAMKQTGAQGYGFTEYTFDEMAWQQYARTCWLGIVPTIGRGKLFGISTPNGKVREGKLFYEVWANPDELPEYKGFARKKIMWYENPEHDEAWFKRATAGLTRQEIAQMFECSFVSYAGASIWNTFNHRIHVSKEKLYPIAGRPILIGWDFGTRKPAMTVWQVDGDGRWRGYMELVGRNVESFAKFCRHGLLMASALYDRSKFQEIHGIAPDAKTRYRTRGLSGARMDMDELVRIWDRRRIGRMENPTFSETDSYQCRVMMGYPHLGTRLHETPRLKVVRGLWWRKDGDPGILLDPSMENFIDGCASGYVYDKEGEVPMENEYTDAQDSFQMIASAYSREILGEVDEDQRQATKIYMPPKMGFRSGM